MNLTERLAIIKLYDQYGTLLSDKQSRIFDMYINNNLSFAEVADMFDISRQAVKYALDNAINSLKNYESKLHFVEKMDNIKQKLENISLKPTSNSINKILEDM